MTSAKTRKTRKKPSERPIRVSPWVEEMPADLLTPVSAFLSLKRKGERAFLLESVEGGERIARYSFLGVNPERCLFIRDGKLWEERDGAEALIDTQGADPLRAIARIMSRYRAESVEGLPPFSGGVVGYVGYDCVRYLERVSSHPGSSAFPYDAYLMLFRNVIAFDHVKHRILLIANLFEDGSPKSALQKRARQELAELRARLERGPGRLATSMSFVPRAAGRNGDLEKLFKPLFGKRRFCESVRRMKRNIRMGDIFQGVLSEQFSFELKNDPFAVYRSLRALSPAPYLYYLAVGAKGDEVLLGASPEMLARVSDGKVEVSPIAGTRPRGETATRDRELERQLLASVKERAEHLMLVDLGRNDIGRIAAPGSVQVREYMQVHRFSHVMHLVSTVEGKLARGVSPWDAFLSCFPAGTLTGAPKIRAMQLIAENELNPRGPYGGAVVYQDFSGRLDSCITIRSLFASRGRATIQAGAGIVADSNPEKEYEEVLNKSRAIRRAVLAVEGGRP